MTYQDFFKGKRVTILGLGLLGRGVGDAAFLADCGAIVTVTDKKTEADLSESTAALEGHSVTFHLGGHIEKDFTDTDMVIKAAGVPLNSPEITAAQKAGVPVYMSTALFAKFAAEMGAIVVGVTGTRGKSTIAHLIHYALVNAGKRAHLGGNIRGISTLATLPEVKKGDICVLELDSWQLQGFGDLEISPHIAVFSNLMLDHQNYYPDMETYFADKANIFRFQKKGDVVYVGASIEEKVRASATSDVAVPPAIPAGWTLKIPGAHNRENVALAVVALEKLGLSREEIRAGLESFEGVEGRLQFVREVNDVRIYNDNNATTPEATIAAIRALDTGKKNIVLIMGGADKNLEIGELLSEIEKNCKSVMLLEGTGTVRFQNEGSSLQLLAGPPALQLKVALDSALQRSDKGDIILFSPAFASFGMFKNEYDRNDQFLKAVRAL